MEVDLRNPTTKGPAEWFTGDVWIDAIAQTLYVTEGEGRVQSRGEHIATIRPGNVIHIPGGEWHWHGAAPDHFMTHLSMSEGDAEWGEHVSDSEYRGKG